MFIEDKKSRVDVASRSVATSPDRTRYKVGNISTVPRVAVCKVGDIRSLVREDAQQNLLRALYEPLLDLQVDTFLVVGDALIKGNSLIKTKNNFSTFEFGGKAPISVKIATEVSRSGAMRVPTSRCQTLGYEQSVRLRECMRQIAMHEKQNGFNYEFIIRTRPDIEYFESLPSSRCWRSLRRDVIWDMDTRFSTGMDQLNADIVKDISEVDFIGDWLSVVPRNIAEWALTSIAGDFEKCIPFTVPTGNVCGKNNHRWGWPECRFKCAYQKGGGTVLAGKLMTESSAKFQWHTLLRCMNSDCSLVKR